jgi:hypothetical protein
MMISNPTASELSISLSVSSAPSVVKKIRYSRKQNDSFLIIVIAFCNSTFPPEIQTENYSKRHEKYNCWNYPKSTTANQTIAIWRDTARISSLDTIVPFPVPHIKQIKEE